jgi:hypothetical protein
MRRSIFFITANALLITGVFLLSFVSTEKISLASQYRSGAHRIIPQNPPPADTHGPVHNFIMYVPWRTEDVVCDGFVDPTTEWSDAALYDISDTSGQLDGIPDPPGTVDLYVKQDSSGVWFAVVDHADSSLDDDDQITFIFDEDHDGCFPPDTTNECQLILLYHGVSGDTVVLWSWLKDFDCDAQSHECMYDENGPLIELGWYCHAVGMTDGKVSYEMVVPYGLKDALLDVVDPTSMDVGFYISTYDANPPGNIRHGEWPSQGRFTTYGEPCYYGDLICVQPWYFKPDYDDYTPSGMPDFDQKQDGWFNPDSSHWTYCGPVALANCLWWFDSKYQWLIDPDSPQPPTINDDFELVTAYGAWDDHDDFNVIPLVDTLAWHMDTDGIRTGDPDQGTNVFEMEAAIAEWLLETQTDNIFYKHTKKAPDFDWIAQEIHRSQDIILLLGFWQYFGPGYVRIGGHYVTCAGVDTTELMLALSDPFYDAAEWGWPGRIRDGILIPHPHGLHGSGVHNDAGNISHDYYQALFDLLTPGGPWSLPDYPPDSTIVVSLQGANYPPEYQDQQGEYNPALPIHTEIEYAVAISPIGQGWHLKGEYPDYAPDGMPDFDQNQHHWQALCGPTAVANCLWWFDSKYQWLTAGGNPPPPFVQDDFDLVTSSIPGHDDHSYETDPVGWDNVQYLIEDLVGYMCTDPVTGTTLEALQNGIDGWLVDRGLDGVFYEHTLIDSTLDPEFFSIIEEEIECCQDVILLLGFWEETGPEEWRRTGGHYVTCAGVCSDSMKIMFSDPDYDQQPITYPDSSTKRHNNAALVSHDIYLVAPSPSPGGYWGLPDYPVYEVSPRHLMQNCPTHLKVYEEEWLGGPLYTEIEAAVLVSPYVKPASVESLWIYTAFGTAAADSKDIRLIWQPVIRDTTGCPVFAHYVVYRDTVPDFAPGPATELSTTTDTTYLDVDIAGNSAVNYFYYVNTRSGPLESDNSRCMGEFDRDTISGPAIKKGGDWRESEGKEW